ncbi:hypothetical protein [Actinoplanes regularis]|uniref:Uncharacterized protein n=1 Tax=Actinoplanes regularis TaxID=52697 RepID=A0A238VBC5_9ACTN|nr:hypothetical protein [Actinoplanes regularis]GIE83633.1 hypothetical protein Are01nite_01130 [Actinoplanes regularis]SNR31521.1 hypothetical protein SAMN06264365_101960 [Actinoplanes regularis]
MTTEPNPPHDEPDDFGFAGDPPLASPAPRLVEGEGERIAVPSDDLTGAITEAIDELTDHKH